MTELGWLDFSRLPQALINLFALVIALNYLFGGRLGEYLSNLTKGFLDDRADRREFKQRQAQDEKDFQRQIFNRYTAWSDKFLEEIDGLLEDMIAEIQKQDLRHLTNNEAMTLILTRLENKIDEALKDGDS